MIAIAKVTTPARVYRFVRSRIISKREENHFLPISCLAIDATTRATECWTNLSVSAPDARCCSKRALICVREDCGTLVHDFAFALLMSCAPICSELQQCEATAYAVPCAVRLKLIVESFMQVENVSLFLVQIVCRADLLLRSRYADLY